MTQMDLRPPAKSVVEDLEREESFAEKEDSSIIANKTESHSTTSSSSPTSSSSKIYPGDLVDDSAPLEDTGWRCFQFPNPGIFVSFYNKSIAEGHVTLHPWQADDLELLGSVKPTSQHPYKYCLVTCNGSGKDAFIIASFVAWFAACKIRSRCIITSSSGVQLTSQTEGYIATLCRAVNEFHGCEIFRVRQRFIKCMLSGSEVRLFATDEAGKAEGYHPLDPGAEMAIIVNEGKSVTEEIHSALRRCTGYNYWLEISTPGEPHGFFYRAATTWPYVRRITYKECPHLSEDEIEQDRIELGENSPLFRSKNLALFTSFTDETVIPQTLVEQLLQESFEVTYPSFAKRVGIDLAAGGDENVICISKGNKCLKEHFFREIDTEITADRIHDYLKSQGIPQDHPYIYADDGGVGRSIIDKLVRRGWKINRVMNQWTAANKKQFGNRGAENWYRVKRIFEEHFFDVSTLTEKTREQLYTRRFKKPTASGRIFLESKKEAKAEGRPSPDRADALILSLTGLTVDDFLNAVEKKEVDGRPKVKLTSQEEIQEHYENEVTYLSYKDKPTVGKRIYNSLRAALARN